MKMVRGVVLAAVVVSMAGCKTTVDDRWRSDLGATLEQAHFRPVYEVQSRKGLVSGEATDSYSFWGLFSSSPETYANEIGGPLVFRLGLKEAAFADACRKADCHILLAPRFTVTKESGFLWFSGKNRVVVEGFPAVLKAVEEIPFEKWVEYQGIMNGNGQSQQPVLPL